ncbi:Fic family protein [Desulfovibrio sp. JC022]|uniref:Fic family protein n=1 Tax=Desulfovibrio sp. JC022 TaxID=2593642 RepID=UPI0013D15B95|nr:Fic family protein [Desulfovibrio sp. JC022]NDV23413.1 Fic family protein [Desulfovibrio sp. JC022]
MITQYKHISALTDEDKSNGSESLNSILTSWTDIKSNISQDLDTLKDFNEKLARSWSIETGVIEGIYTLDQGTTVTLIEHGFASGLVAHDASNLDEKELYEILNDQKEALDWVFDFVKEERKLTTSYIKELHALLTNSQHSLTVVTPDGKSEKRAFEQKGTWKTQPNNPQQPDGTVFHYCPPEQVAQEMDNLVEWYEEYSNSDIPPEVLAAWLHHRFVLIHPFQDGNGRVARALASLVFIKAGLFPLIVERGEQRKQYIDALKKADAGELKPLSDFFAELQSSIVYRAIDLARAASTSPNIATEIFAHKLKEKEFIAGRANVLNTIASKIKQYTDSLLKPYAKELSDQLKKIHTDYNAQINIPYAEDEFIVQIKQAFAHRPDLKTECEEMIMSGLLIDEHNKNWILFVAFPLATETKKFATIAFLIEDLSDKNYPYYSDIQLITFSPFIYLADHNFEEIKTKYKEWFDTAITLCLASLEKRVSG